MIWMWWALGIIVALLILLLITPIRLDVTYWHNGDDDQLTIKITVWKVISKTIEVPVIAIDKESPSLVFKEEVKGAGGDKEYIRKETPNELVEQVRELNRWLQQIVGLHRIARRFLKHVKVKRFNWSSSLGAGDASTTGWLSGLIWSIKGSMAGLLSSYLTLKCIPELKVDPIFQGWASKTHLECMVTLQLGHAIFAGILVVRHTKGEFSSLFVKHRRSESHKKEA